MKILLQRFQNEDPKISLYRYLAIVPKEINIKKTLFYPKLTSLLSILILCSQFLQGQPVPRGFRNDSPSQPLQVTDDVSPFGIESQTQHKRDNHNFFYLPESSISHIIMHGAKVWLGTSTGISYTSDLGATWEQFDSTSGIGRNGIYALSYAGDTLWTATGYNSSFGPELIPTGGGLSYTPDDGATWHHIPQPIDASGDSIIAYGINDSLWILPIKVVEQNVSYDISTNNHSIWIASWAGGLRKSDDKGNGWQRILLPLDDMNSLSPNDTLWHYSTTPYFPEGHRVFRRFDPRRDNNLLPFSILATSENTIWCGTAGGINKSTDGGASWVRYTHQNTTIAGNWVIALHFQERSSGPVIWASNWPADDPDELYATSFSINEGQNWKIVLKGKKTFYIYSVGDTSFVCTTQGLYRTADLLHWQRFSNAPDTIVYCMAQDSLGRLWLGTSHGLRIYNTSGQIWEEDVPDANSKPQIVSLLVPDTLERPATGIAMVDISVNVTDYDGQDDIFQVWFTTKKPNGTTGGPIFLSSNGNGKFILMIRIDSTAILGTHIWTFFAEDMNGEISDSVVRSITIIPANLEGVKGNAFIPPIFALYQNYPNPFNPTTKIRYSIPEAGFVILKIYDLLGREIRTLVDKPQQGGSYQTEWNGKNDSSAPVSSGIYTCRITATTGTDTYTKTIKIVFVK